ncbi:hypothetical protein UFOVP181_234 [uncultured Caudovirales phage]|uniref:Uncharacterized protein n=1 Tax=uncultured Caudovirales phage TaxID=2100421 RepID=A0A6J5KUE5_9CAUD|nr:hypothetical protein UFOVP57_405 [uncultured Caudovirales phage]CAB5208889.1 hypothetical protein UFOVP181_234 [uncultured Caudovirales phage]
MIMPIPIYSSDETEFFYRRATWEKTFVLWPRTCDQSGKRIWLEYAYKGTRMITGPGDPVFLFRWVNRKEYVFAQLKGIIT